MMNHKSCGTALNPGGAYCPPCQTSAKASVKEAVATASHTGSPLEKAPDDSVNAVSPDVPRPPYFAEASVVDAHNPIAVKAAGIQNPKRILLFCVAALFVLAVVIVSLLSPGDSEGNAQETAKKYIYTTYMGSIATAQEYSLINLSLLGVPSDQIDYMQRNYGKNYTVTVDIVSSAEVQPQAFIQQETASLSSSEKIRLRNSLTANLNDIDQVYELDTLSTIYGSEGSDEETLHVYCCKVKGKWLVYVPFYKSDLL